MVALSAYRGDSRFGGKFCDGGVELKRSIIPETSACCALLTTRIVQGRGQEKVLLDHLQGEPHESGWWLAECEKGVGSSVQARIGPGVSSYLDGRSGWARQKRLGEFKLAPLRAGKPHSTAITACRRSRRVEYSR